MARDASTTFKSASLYRLLRLGYFAYRNMKWTKASFFPNDLSTSVDFSVFRVTQFV